MALEAGANAFLSKPVTSQELVERVEAVLRAGVNYRVHTGLLTEPVPPPGSPSAPPAATAAPPPGRPIGADDQPEPGLAPGSLPVITVASLRGGTGSTTVAVNLAFLLAMRGRRVCVADLSTTSGHVTLHVRQIAQHHWGHLLPAGDALDGDMVARLLIRHTPSGIAILPAPPLPTATTLSRTATATMLGELSRTFNHVIVDAPNLDDATTTALQLARAVVVVMSDDPPSVQSTAQPRCAERGRRGRAGARGAQPCAPSPRHSAGDHQKAIKGRCPRRSYDANPINAMRRGLPLAAAEPDSAFSQAIQLLARTMTSDPRRVPRS